MSVSVIVTCHNEAEYIKQCINSIIRQSDYNSIDEIIVINDASIDDSLKILDKLKQSNDKLNIITTNGIGVSASRNLGIKKSKSDFIAFLDGDDFWESSKLENHLKAFNNNPLIGLTYGDFWDFSKHDKSDLKHITVKSLNDVNQLFEYFVYDAPIVPSTTVCRKEVFETVGLFNEKFKSSEDTEMYLRIVEKWKFFYVAGTYSYKRKSLGQITHRQDKLLKNQELIGQMAVKRSPQLKNFLKKRNSYRNLKVGIDLLVNHNEKKATLVHAFKAFKLDIFNYRALVLMIMILVPHKLRIYIYNLLKSIFYKIRNRRYK
jgi:glycosyltransferase involved in cell wall biosynthesis